MIIRIVGVIAVTLIVLCGLGAVIYEQSTRVKSECVREGIRQGWASEAIKELCQ